MTSNTGYPLPFSIQHFATDSFARYFVLETLEETPFDPTGCTFSLEVRQGQNLRPSLSFLNRAAIVTGGVCYVPFLKEADIYNSGVFNVLFRITKAGKTDTLLTGKLLISSKPDQDELQDDAFAIDSPKWKIIITVLTIPPVDGEAEEPEPSISTYFADNYVENPTDYVLNL